MSSPPAELFVTLSSVPSALELLLETGELSKKPSYIEIIAAATENNRAVSPVILSSRKNVESVAGVAEGKFKLKPITIVLDKDFGLKLAIKYCIKIALYDESRSKLAESSKFITTFAESPATPVITSARSKNVGQVELSLRLGKWSGADVRSARVYLFKDVENATSDDITLLDIATTITEHATGADFILDLAPHVVLDVNTDYIVRVAFESKIGLGDFSEAFSFKAVDVPDSPLDVSMEHLHLDNTLSIKWKAGADSRQYGNLLRFRVDLSVMPFEGRTEEITFASVAQKVPLFEGFKINSKIDLVKFNKHEFVFDRAAQTEFLNQMSVQFPQYTVSRQLKFKARVTASDGMNISEPTDSSQITVIRLGLTDNYTQIFDVTAKGLQTKKESGIERKINVEAKLKNGITYAELKKLLVDLPTPTRSLGVPPPPAPWAKGIAFQLDLIQGDFKNSFVNRIIVDNATPVVSTTPISTDVPFSTLDELKLTFWLIDANDNKSYSMVYPVPIPIEVPALVYPSDTSYTVNAGIVSIPVNVVSGTKTETISAKFLLRNFSNISPNPAPFVETLPLLLVPTGLNEYEFKISYNPQLPANASQVSEIKLSVFEKQVGVTTPLQIYSERNVSRVVISSTNLTDIAESVQLKLFDRTVSPSSPSEYAALLYVEKSIILQKLKVHNNDEMTQDITINWSAEDTVLTIADESLSENKIDITFAGRNLTSLRIPIASDLQLASDLALLNKSSLKDTHLFVYLNIQNLRPSPSPVRITAKVNRLIDGQSYAAESLLSGELQDDIGFVDVSSGRTYDFDGTQIGFRVNRNDNFSDTMFITSWPIAYDGKSIDTPEPVFNYVASNQFILRNNRSEVWALINLKAGGGPLAYPVAAVMVILSTANRLTSNTFKVFLKDESIDGSIILELNAIRSGGLLMETPFPTRPDISLGYSVSPQETYRRASIELNAARAARLIRETEANDAMVLRTIAQDSVTTILLDIENTKSKLASLIENKQISDATYLANEHILLIAERIVVDAKAETERIIVELDDTKIVLLRLQDEFSQLIPVGTNTQNDSDLAHEITRQINDTIFRLSQLEEAKVDSEQRLLSVRQDYDNSQANFLLAKDKLVIITSDIQTTEQELLRIEYDLVVAQNSLLVAENSERIAQSALLLAVTNETVAIKEFENIRLALVIF
jgi:hypothetical protein